MLVLWAQSVWKKNQNGKEHQQSLSLVLLEMMHTWNDAKELVLKFKFCFKSHQVNLMLGWNFFHQKYVYFFIRNVSILSLKYVFYRYLSGAFDCIRLSVYSDKTIFFANFVFVKKTISPNKIFYFVTPFSTLFQSCTCSNRYGFYTETDWVKISFRFRHIFMFQEQNKIESFFQTGMSTASVTRPI